MMMVMMDINEGTVEFTELWLNIQHCTCHLHTDVHVKQ